MKKLKLGIFLIIPIPVALMLTCSHPKKVAGIRVYFSGGEILVIGSGERWYALYLHTEGWYVGIGNGTNKGTPQKLMDDGHKMKIEKIEYIYE